MRAALSILAAVLLAAFAFHLREASADSWRRAPQGLDSEQPTWLVDDPDAAYHLRRVELGLRLGQVPQRDAFLSHPNGSAVPWPPLFDASLVWLAETFLGAQATDSERLESFLVHVPPVLGALACLAVALLVLALTRGSFGSRLAAAGMAGLIYAATPIAVWYGGVTRIDHHVASALLLALLLGVVARALRARSTVEVLVFGLASGALIAASLLVWLGSAVFVLVAFAALFMGSLVGEREPAQRVARIGALAFLVAAALMRAPAEASPWNQVTPGSLLALTTGVPQALLAGAAPFAVCLLPRPARGGAALRGALAVATGLVLVLLLPGFKEGAREGLDWASRHTLFMDVVEESRPLLGRDGVADWGHAIRRLGWPLLAFPLAWLALLRGFRRPERLLLLATGAVALALTLGQERFGNSLAVPLSATLGVALHALASQGRLRLSLGLAVILGVATLDAARGVLSVPEQQLAAVRDWRVELVDGLRWLRTEGTSPELWDDPEAVMQGGVLSAWGLGHLVEYHARQPTVATNFGSYVGESGFRASARALLAEDPKQFAAQLERLRVDFVVVTPRQAGDIKSLARVAGLEGRPWLSGESKLAARTALWRLALPAPGVAAEHYPGLERVFAAPSRESTRGGRPGPGELAGPVLSIYRVLDPDPGEREAVMRPR